MSDPEHEKINYVEFPSTDLNATKAFFKRAFGWKFEDYGEEYTAFAKGESGLDGGFFQAEQPSKPDAGSALVVLYSSNLEKSQAKVEDAGAKIVKPIFTFPGGRRFHFTEPGGNELAIWSDIVH